MFSCVFVLSFLFFCEWLIFLGTSSEWVLISRLKLQCFRQFVFAFIYSCGHANFNSWLNVFPAIQGSRNKWTSDLRRNFPYFPTLGQSDKFLAVPFCTTGFFLLPSFFFLSFELFITAFTYNFCHRF